MLLRNGVIYTSSDPAATAMLVVGDRIEWTGTEPAAASYADSADEVVDLGGALVTPAFVDAHIHVLQTALSEHGVDVAGARSLPDFLERLSAYAAAHPGEPVIGQGWDENTWPEGRPPTREEVERATNGAVVLLSRVDGHSSVVSTALLERAPAIAGSDGYEDGLVRRQAQTVARRALQDGIPDDRRRALHRDVLRHAAALGIGAVHEMAAPHITSEHDLRLLVDLSRSEPLPEVVPYWGEAGVERARAVGAAGAAGDLTVDGSLGSRSARLTQPYADDPSTRGQLYLDVDAAAEHVVACTEAGMQAGFHCIGDEAVRVAVGAISRAAERCGEAAVRASRHRLEHVEMITPDLIGEMARLGVLASVQPPFDELWGGRDGLYAARLGPDRAAALNPFASMLDAGVTLAFGSDSPVAPVGGWETVRAAAYHRTPQQRMSVRDAFAAATRGGRLAARVDDAGVLAPGMQATYAVWDVSGRPARAAGKTSTGLPDLSPGTDLPRCVRTVVRGRTVFAADQSWAEVRSSD